MAAVKGAVRTNANGDGIAYVDLDNKKRNVHIQNLVVEEPEVYEYLARASPTEHTGLVVRALRVGAIALRDAGVATKVDYVDKEFTRFKNEITERLVAYFGPKGEIVKFVNENFGDDGEMQEKLESFLGEKGQLRDVLEQFMGENGTVTGLLGEDGELDTRLNEFFGPKGKLREELDKTFGAEGGQIFALLNPGNKNGPVGGFLLELKDMFNPDKAGSPMHQLRTEVRQNHATLLKELGIGKGREAEKAKGTSQGRDYEDDVFDAMQDIAEPFGDPLDEVGATRGATRKRGDSLATINADETGGAALKIIVEAKKRDVHLSGSNSIYKELEEAMQNRKAQFSIAVIHPDNAKPEFDPFRFRAPNMILCVVDPNESDLPLRVAYRLARTLVIRQATTKITGLDLETVQAAEKKIRAKLTEFQAISSKLTQAATNIAAVKEELDGIRKAIVEELADLVARAKVGDAAA